MSGAEVRVTALPSAHRFRPGDDVSERILAALAESGAELADGDILCVASKVVALAEGALIPADEVASAVAATDGDERATQRDLARSRATEVVAEAPWVTVTRTHHGFVAANGGIDRSNVPDEGWLDLPRDPDASAATIRTALGRATGREVGVIVTDTFGRPWRLGQTDVALGAAGVAVLRDERGSVDLDGRRLDVTIAAIGDAIAGAADLVRSKASAAPFVLVRGLAALTAAGGAATGRAADLVRPLDEDLFRRGAADATLEGIMSRRTVRALDTARAVPIALVEEAVAAATTAPAPHGGRPLRVVRLRAATRTALLDALADAWRTTMRSDGVDGDTAAGRIARSDALHRTAPELLAVFVDVTGARPYPDAERTRAERDLFVLAGGAALEAMLVALSSRGLGAAWTSSTVFDAATVRAVLDVPDTWEPLGTVAVGWPSGPVAPRSAATHDGVLEER